SPDGDGGAFAPPSRLTTEGKACLAPTREEARRLATAHCWIIDDRHVKILHLARDILLACVRCEASSVLDSQNSTSRVTCEPQVARQLCARSAVPAATARRHSGVASVVYPWLSAVQRRRRYSNEFELPGMRRSARPPAPLASQSDSNHRRREARPARLRPRSVRRLTRPRWRSAEQPACGSTRPTPTARPSRRRRLRRARADARPGREVPRTESRRARPPRQELGRARPARARP